MSPPPRNALEPSPPPAEGSLDSEQTATATPPVPPKEQGGRKDGTDPTRYGDWEKGGRCIDF